jgi:hypothetical protein
MIFSSFNDKHLLVPKYSGASSLEVLCPFTFLIRFSIGCSAPLYSRSGSLIGSAYSFLYWQAASITQAIFVGKNAVNKHFLQSEIRSLVGKIDGQKDGNVGVNQI